MIHSLQPLSPTLSRLSPSLSRHAVKHKPPPWRRLDPRPLHSTGKAAKPSSERLPRPVLASSHGEPRPRCPETTRGPAVKEDGDEPRSQGQRSKRPAKVTMLRASELEEGRAISPSPHHNSSGNQNRSDEESDQDSSRLHTGYDK